MTSRKEEGGGKATSNTRAKDMEHKNMTKGEGGQKMSKFAWRHLWLIPKSLYGGHNSRVRVLKSDCDFHSKNTGCCFITDLSTQLSQMEQWEALGGRNILHVKQYFNFIVWLLITISLVLGGGRYAVPLPTTVCTSICRSISAASSFVARGKMPGSLKLVLNRFDITNMKRTAAMTGTAGVTLTAK